MPLCCCTCLHCAGCHFSHHILTWTQPRDPRSSSPGHLHFHEEDTHAWSQLAALGADPHYGHPKEPEVLELSTAVGQPEAWVARSTLPESSSLPGLTKAKHRCHHAKTIESCFAALGMLRKSRSQTHCIFTTFPLIPSPVSRTLFAATFPCHCKAGHVCFSAKCTRYSQVQGTLCALKSPQSSQVQGTCSH